MSKFCRKHVKERTIEELEKRYQDLKTRAAKGEKIGPGLLREMENIRIEWGQRHLPDKHLLFKEPLKERDIFDQINSGNDVD